MPATPTNLPRDFGFKILSSPGSPTSDVIFIHGLDGHRTESCTAENGKMWLSEFLPDEMPDTRIMTFGYDGYTEGRNQFSTQTLRGHATDLLSRLVNKRTGCESRPIIFVAHNVGGIILKSALIAARNCNDRHLPHHRKVFDATIGVIFFGTPHQGTPHNYLRVTLNNTGKNDIVAQHLKQNSEWLQRQLVQYLPIAAMPRITTIYFYEEYGTVAVAGKEPIMLVPKHTAVVPGSAGAESMKLSRHHEMLTKFNSPDEDDYVLLTETMQKLAGYQEFRHARNREAEAMELL